MRDVGSPVSVLFATVGRGDPNNLDETLYRPIVKSIQAGDWDHIVLLPSRDTLPCAEELQQRCRSHDVHVRPLPEAGNEYDPEACYRHFTEVLKDFLPAVRGTIAVDITRGTKAMSAALLLAAFRHNVEQARYVQAEPDPNQYPGVRPGSERVFDTPMGRAQRDRILDQAANLMDEGNFAAAARLLEPTPWDELKGLASLARFYAAWDRLDYETADRITIPAELPTDWERYRPQRAAKDWVHALAGQLPDAHDPDYAPAMAAYLRRVTVDLWANGLRRIRQFQHEDAVLRAYRTLELIGQARLFDHGLDSARLPTSHPAVERLVHRLSESGSPQLAANQDGTLKAAREQVARLLDYLGDPLAKPLKRFATEGEFSVIRRNHSLLIHGFRAVSPSDASSLRDAYRRLERLIRQDRESHAQENVDADFAVARTPEFIASA